MLEFLSDPNFLGAMAGLVGPVAFFAAPTEEIEYLISHSDLTVCEDQAYEPNFVAVTDGIAKAA